MKSKLLLLAALALPLSLAACGPEDVKAVQNTTVKSCGYLPTAQTVVNIAAALYTPATIFVDAASQIASKICTAVTTNPLADGPGASVRYKPQVAGVVIKGTFVK